MNEQTITTLLQLVHDQQMSVTQAVEKLRLLPAEVIESARIDHHRSLRTGLPEAVFGEHKTSDQLVEIVTAMLAAQTVVLATRISAEKAKYVCARLPELTYHPVARLLSGNDHLVPHEKTKGPIILVTAGTSDLPVAEEARVTLQLFGHPVQTIYDAGVAGIHRILSHSALLQQAGVIIVVAGMEGALPSVVAGMTPAPVIGVPTSIGYGTGAGGYSALLGMLNSCSPGLAVVNIDNGFGAACMAAAINRIL